MGNFGYGGHGFLPHGLGVPIGARVGGGYVNGGGGYGHAHGAVPPVVGEKSGDGRFHSHDNKLTISRVDHDDE